METNKVVGVKRKDVEFLSKGTKIRGVLALPDGEGPFPVVVMAGGWCYVKEIVMPHYAERILEAGIACLWFDYRGFGGSDGAVRQDLNSWAQIEDYKNAISFVTRQPELDPNRVGVWGISYSGGHVVVLGATDPRVKCVVSTVPVVQGYETMQRCHGVVRFEEVKELVQRDRESRYEGNPSARIPMSVLNPQEVLAVWPLTIALKVFEDIKAREAPLHEHWSTVESLENLLDYDITPYAKRIINTPTLFCVAEEDHATHWDLEIAMFNSIPANNKKLVILEKISHMSLYSSKTQLEVASAEHAAFLKQHLVDKYRRTS
jgi:dienelactone hydrolase